VRIIILQNRSFERALFDNFTYSSLQCGQFIRDNVP